MNPSGSNVHVTQDIFTNPEFLKEFLELYRAHPCLWKITSKDYSNRHIKHKAHKELVKLCLPLLPTANVELVKSKIQNLRTVFKKELNKVRESQRSGAGADDIYTPRLWYYDLLLFTADQEEPRQSVSSLQDTNVEKEPNEEDPHNQNDSEENTEPSTSQETTQTTQKPQGQVARKPHKLPAKKTRKRVSAILEDCEDAMHKATTIMNQKDDECDAFGNIVATKLRTLSKDKSLMLQSSILDLLNKAQLNIAPPVYPNISQPPHVPTIAAQTMQPHFQSQHYPANYHVDQYHGNPHYPHATQSDRHQKQPNHYYADQGEQFWPVEKNFTNI
ncbi:uncharacterized protein [Hyperolius riggenbachi]|uniref:uncharacterized protein n=1 Tax=Hyperolius riggenbachi TaxID=752182 RepID=UPI0035A33D5E